VETHRLIQGGRIDSKKDSIEFCSFTTADDFVGALRPSNTTVLLSRKK
jgi:hypothetical protein